MDYTHVCVGNLIREEECGKVFVARLTAESKSEKILKIKQLLPKLWMKVKWTGMFFDSHCSLCTVNGNVDWNLPNIYYVCQKKGQQTLS